MSFQNRRCALGVSALILFGGLTTSCAPPEQNPVAALSAVEKVQTGIAAIDSGADPFDAIQGVLKQLNASELASAANLLGGLNLSLSDAQGVLDLVALIDPMTLDYLENSGLDVLNRGESPEVVASALQDYGDTGVTADQVATFFQLLSVFNI